jgi:DNA gyrase subunit A
MQTSDRNGKIVGATQVIDDDQVMLISDQGTLVRTSVAEISVQGRNTQGVRLIAVRENESLVGLERVVETDETEQDEIES